eukprot:4878794-Prymnesium_polylepis.1
MSRHRASFQASSVRSPVSTPHEQISFARCPAAAVSGDVSQSLITAHAGTHPPSEISIHWTQTHLALDDARRQRRHDRAVPAPLAHRVAAIVVDDRREVCVARHAQ